jgi:fumarate hydratase, class I
MKNYDFPYQPLMPHSEDTTTYLKISSKGVKQIDVQGKKILTIEKDTMIQLTKRAMKEINHFLRAKHLAQLSKIIADPEASDNDKYVATTLLENAVIAAEGVFPSCQDTGTAIVFAKKGQYVWTEGDDDAVLSEGIYQAYKENNLRYSQVAPLDMFQEKNTGTNLPAQIDIYATDGDEYHFMFIAKGGGSANKTYLYQQTKALLNPHSIEKFLDEKIRTLGTAACPPYHLAIVIGGTSAEATTKTVKLASTGYYDNLPEKGNEFGQAFRDRDLEERVLKMTQHMGIGAQFGGKYFCHDVKVIRLPRHGASCPVAIGVSCSADRQIKAKITSEGVFLEELEMNPARFLPVDSKSSAQVEAVHIDLNQGMQNILKTLSQYPIKTRVMLSGKIIVARDIAHAKLKERLDQTGDVPQYFKDNVIYYAGPAKTPTGHASGSFGPTTAQRMDGYLAAFQAKGASLVTLAKGNRSQEVTDSCKKYGGFYLGSIGGPAAQLGRDCITDVKILEYSELGMEAIFEITVKDFPAFIVVDDKGHDFFKEV